MSDHLNNISLKLYMGCPIKFRLWVMRSVLNSIFSGVILILAHKFTLRFTLWLLLVMNKSIKDYNIVLATFKSCGKPYKFTTRTIVYNTSFTIHQKS